MPLAESIAGVNPVRHGARPAGDNPLWGAMGKLVQRRAQAQPLIRIARQGPVPLSVGQERLWLAEQSETGTACYHIPLAWEVQGEFDIAVLERSLNAIIKRHEVLRTAFPVVQGTPLAQAAAHLSARIEAIDVRGAAVDRRAEGLVRACEFVRRPFDLAKGPLIRAALICLGEQHWLFVLAVHQIVFDGGSMQIVSRELAEFYRSFLGSRPPMVPDLPIQYCDFAAWQHGTLGGQLFDEARAYWTRVMASEWSPLPLFSEQAAPRSPHAAVCGRVGVQIPRELTNSLVRLASGRQATLFTVVLAAWNALLCLRTGQEDVIVFSSLAARSRPEVRNLIGLVANVLPFRTDVSGDPSFSELLRRSSEAVTGGFAYQDYPFARIMEMLRVGPGNRHTPLMQTMLIFQNTPLPRLELPGVTMTPCGEVDNGAAKFDLLLELSDTGRGLHGWLKYRTDVCEHDSARRLMGDFLSVLSAAVEDPDERISAVSVAAVPRLASAAAAGPAARLSPMRTHPAAMDQVQRSLVRIWEEVLGVPVAGIGDDFFDLGGNSLLALRLVTRIESEFHTPVPLHLLFRAKTMEQVAAHIRGQASGALSAIVHVGGDGAGLPFHCVHSIGGEVMSFRHLARRLGPEQRLYGIQAPPDRRTPEFASSIEAMAACYVAELTRFQPDGPYMLGGWSAGSTIALEMARQLTAQGREVALVVALDGAPFNTASGTPWWSPLYAAKLLKNLPYWIADDLMVNFSLRRLVRRAWNKACAFGRRSLDRIRRVPDGAAAVASFMDTSGFSPNHVRFMNALLAALRSYVPQRYDGSVLAYQARTEPLYHLFEVDRAWRSLAGSAEIVRVPGNHLSLIDEPNVQAIATDLAPRLAAIRRGL